MIGSRDTSRPIVLLALAMLTFLPFLGRRDIVTSHEARVVRAARQMAESGWPWDAALLEVPRSELRTTPEGERLLPRADGGTMSVNPWIVPVMNGQVRLQKPPLPYWCTAILYRAIGFSEFSSRLIPALLGAISVLIVWDFSRLLLGRVGAWYAAMVWVSSYFIVDEFRKTMADPYLAFFVLASVWAWTRARRKCRAAAFWTILFYFTLALGILAKGPIILLFDGVILAAMAWCYQRKSRSHSKHLPAHLIGIVVLIVITLPWAIAVIRSVPNAVELWRFESIGALSDKSENARPWWFYLPNVFQITLPWTPLWIMGLILPFKFPKRRRFFGVVSLAALVLVFSCSYAKKNAYLLPLMFINAMIVAEALRWLTLIPRRRSMAVAIFRTTVTAVAFSIAVQVFVSVIQPAIDNARSPREAVRFVANRIEASGGAESLLYSRLPDEVTVYLPLGFRESQTAKQFLLIVDDRKPGLAQSTARGITATTAGPVTAVEEVSNPDSLVTRWKIYRLNVVPP